MNRYGYAEELYCVEHYESSRRVAVYGVRTAKGKGTLFLVYTSDLKWRWRPATDFVPYSPDKCPSKSDG